MPQLQEQTTIPHNDDEQLQRLRKASAELRQAMSLSEQAIATSAQALQMADEALSLVWLNRP